VVKFYISFVHSFVPHFKTHETIWGDEYLIPQELFFRHIKSVVWSKQQQFSKALSKGPQTTTWIWNLHSDAHDFDMQESSIAVITRKVFSSSLAHLALVFFWMSGMHFHGAYFSNYSAWLKDPKHYVPSAQLVWSIVGQDILNSDIGNYF
jgi:photosystem I P700 chlorophyll a apoprotein A1